MAPDRGSEDSSRSIDQARREEARQQLSKRASEPQNFTLRSILVGSAIGVVIAFSNTYFGLQTGWISSMAMPSALIGFAWFKATASLISYPFTPVENVLVQTVAGSVGTMPLGCGFVGVIPALEFLLKPNETPDGTPGLSLPLGKLIVWALGVCFFGVVFAVPLRKEVIIREKLKFPSGTATALMIGVLHGDDEKNNVINMDSSPASKATRDNNRASEEEERLLNQESNVSHDAAESASRSESGGKEADLKDWKARIRLLSICFGASAFYTVVSYFIPQLHDIPIFGMTLASDWLWTLNPSPAYVGQGIIMGPATTLHMLLGAIIGWGILSPVAKSKGWAPGAVSDWTNGSKGWIVWISLAIMLADSIVSLGWLVLRPTIALCKTYYPSLRSSLKRGTLGNDLQSLLGSGPKPPGYSTVSPAAPDPDHASDSPAPQPDDAPEPDAPPEHQIGPRVTIIGLILSLGVCIGAVHYAFADLIPLHLTVFSLVLALLLSIMGVRALGETDLNPVSGISKLTQLFFALVTPKGDRNAVIINLIAGAVSESGALQAGDLLQDLKTGHLLGASPKAQFYGQIIGSTLGAVVSACVYKLYTSVYEVPGGMFQVPTGYVWVFTARLVTGDGLPDMAAEFAGGAAVIFAVFTMVRIWGAEKVWRDFVPGGIAVAVGMYNTPSFTLARTIGGLITWYWVKWRKSSETSIIILASGLILGEGLMSIANLALASLKVPHL